MKNKSLKSVLALLMAALMLASTLTGCSKKEEDELEKEI